MQPSPESPLTLPKQEESSAGSLEGSVEEGRFMSDSKQDGAEKSSFSGKEFNSMLYTLNCIYKCHDLKVIGLS